MSEYQCGYKIHRTVLTEHLGQAITNRPISPDKIRTESVLYQVLELNLDQTTFEVTVKSLTDFNWNHSFRTLILQF